LADSTAAKGLPEEENETEKEELKKEAQHGKPRLNRDSHSDHLRLKDL
jgi:hypothetical protein